MLEEANPTFTSSSFLGPATEPTMVDRISNLPDELLCHILSFLPIKFAVTTTVLSKRWNPLFYSLPVLSFDISTHPLTTVDQFCRFVDNIMLSPLSTKQPTLKKFSLFLTVEMESSLFNFNAWVKAATRRGIEELQIILCRRTLKPNVFISQTLVVVKLCDLQIGTDTLSVHLPSLKTLHLKYVYFTNLNDFINFLSACPNVDDLEVVGCPIFHKLVKARTGPIFAKLVKASIGPIYSRFTNIYAEVNKLIEAITAMLFNGIRNVQFVRIGIVTEASFKVIPVFSNLIHIELVFSSHRPSHWDDVVDIIQHCPKLKILFIKKGRHNGISNEWKCPISALECVSSHLNSCTILDFQGSTNDLRFAKYILQNAKLLQDMTINVAIKGTLFLEKSQIIEELSSCPRISPGCKLSFDLRKISRINSVFHPSLL